MAIVANRVKTKGYLHEIWHLIVYTAKKFSIVFLLLLSLLLLGSNAKAISGLMLEIVGKTVGACSLIYETVIDKTVLFIEGISYYKDLEAENTRLKVEVAKLQDRNEKTLAANNENSSLKQLLNVVEQLEHPYITAKLLSVSHSPYASTAIIGAGSSNGVKINDVVTSTHGLVGRIIEVSNNYSTAMLIDDYNSRIPVITSNTRMRGILAKINTKLKIIYLDDHQEPEQDEIIYTSGDGKIFPDDIKVGKISKVDKNGVFVTALASLKNINYVLIQSLTTKQIFEKND